MLHVQFHYQQSFAWKKIQLNDRAISYCSHVTVKRITSIFHVFTGRPKCFVFFFLGQQLAGGNFLKCEKCVTKLLSFCYNNFSSPPPFATQNGGRNVLSIAPCVCVWEGPFTVSGVWFGQFFSEDEAHKVTVATDPQPHWNMLSSKQQTIQLTTLARFPSYD